MLVLDDCEHLTDPVAELIDTLLDVTRHLRFLVTSREPLDLPDEQQVHVPPLDVDDDLQAPAVALFAAAAARVGVTFGVGDVGVVAHICRQLDGLPLALELTGRAASLTDVDRSVGQARPPIRAPRTGADAAVDNARPVCLVSCRTPGRCLAARSRSFSLSWPRFPVRSMSMRSKRCARAEKLVCRPGPCPVWSIAALSPSTGRVVCVCWRRRSCRTQRTWGCDTDSRDRHTNWCLQHLRAFPYEARHTSLTMVGWAANHYDDLRARRRPPRLPRWARGTCRTLPVCRATPSAFPGRPAGRRSSTGSSVTCLTSASTRSRPAFSSSLLRALGSALVGRTGSPLAAQDAITSLRLSGRPEDLAAALLIGSWMMAFRRDTDAALERLEEALAIADGASAVAMANSIRAYQANHLTVAGRLEEAKGVLADLFLRLADTPYDYARHNFYLVSAAAWIIDEPEQSVRCHDCDLDRISAGGISLRRCASRV